MQQYFLVINLTFAVIKRKTYCTSHMSISRDVMLMLLNEFIACFDESVLLMLG